MAPVHSFLIIGLALFDTVIHFYMDRIKASPNMWGQFKYPDKLYFRALGVDQAVHHLTHYAIIVVLVLAVI